MYIILTINSNLVSTKLQVRHGAVKPSDYNLVLYTSSFYTWYIIGIYMEIVFREVDFSYRKRTSLLYFN